MKTPTTISTENFLSIFNKPDHLEITPLLQLILKLSTGEEMILFKKEAHLVLPTMGGHHPTTPTGI